MSYTKGPWIAIKGDTFNPERTWGVSKYLSREAHYEIDGDDMEYPSRTEVIAEVLDGPTMEEDAHLIAAAPELVEALEAMMKALRNIRDENYDNWLKVVDAPTMNAWTQCTQALTKAKGGQP